MMAIVQTLQTIENLKPPWYQGIRRNSVSLYDQYNHDYATLFRTQPNVRLCVEFLARNLAQLTPHQYLKDTDTDDRLRLSDFGMTKLLAMPLPAKYKVTRYRLIEAAVSDLAIYFNSYWLKIRDETGAVVGLLRIPPQYMYPEGNLVVKSYKLKVGGYEKEIDSEDIVHIRGYNPENPIFGLSPLETLRRVLAEEDAAGRYREEFWRNSAKVTGIIERPPDAPDWSETARERFLIEFEELYAKEGNRGRTAVLEEGMKWVDASHSARESEYLGGRKLTRTECARSYHIPPPMVGILEHATFSNIREQHKNLYQDTLGPWVAMLEQDIDLQLLYEFSDEGIDINLVYTEFNILEKLQGSFEEQIDALFKAIGRPWMTPDEGRAVLNMRSIGGESALLGIPLNFTLSGQSESEDPKSLIDPYTEKYLTFSVDGKKAFTAYHPNLVENLRAKWREILEKYFERQSRAILSRVKPYLDNGAEVWFDLERWNEELKNDLFGMHLTTTMFFAKVIFEQTGKYSDNPAGLAEFEKRLYPLLKEKSRIQAEKTNELTVLSTSEALTDSEAFEAVKAVFKTALGVRTTNQTITAVTFGASLGSYEAAQASGLSSKTWRVNSGNPRDTHAALNNVTIGIREVFANGLRWPGDSRGPSEEVSGCQCSIEFK